MVFTGLSEVPQVGRDVFSRGFEIVPGGTFPSALHRLVKVRWIRHLGNDLFLFAGSDGSRRIDRALQTRDFWSGVAASFSLAHDRALSVSIPAAGARRSDRAPRARRVVVRAFSGQIEQSANQTNELRYSAGLPAHGVNARHTSWQTPCVYDVFAWQIETLHLTKTDRRTRWRNWRDRAAGLIKRGANGAIARRGVNHRAASISVVGITGADCFNAGFILAICGATRRPLPAVERYRGLSTRRGEGRADLAAPGIAQQYERRARPSSSCTWRLRASPFSISCAARCTRARGI
jgi:hypothetical protein